MWKECKYCHREFWTDYIKKEYCSEHCAYKYNYERSRASILAKYKKPRNSIDNVIKSKKSNKVVFNFIMELNQLTTLSYGKLMQYYPDLNKIKAMSQQTVDK